MGTVEQWAARSRGKLASARILLSAGQLDDVVELCLFAVEMGLKAQIAVHYQLASVPETKKDWKLLTSCDYMIHDLDTLLLASQREAAVKTANVAEWSEVVRWEVGVRYEPPGTVSFSDAEQVIVAAETILSILWN